MNRVIESLFQSEAFFWLSTAVATGFAAEEIEKFCAEQPGQVDTKDIVALFHQCVRNNTIAPAEMEQAKRWSLENLQKIDQWNRQTLVFHEKRSLGICKGFTAYWLNHKLMELEWQQVLGQTEVEEMYLFLDQVLADSAELQEIEQACAEGALSEDQRLFLRSHWQRSQVFWTNLYSDLQLFALGIIEMRRPESARL